MTAVELAAPFLGAIILETIHWYQLRSKMHLAKFRKALRSPTYWIITVAMIILGGFGALVLFGDDLDQGQLLLAGAAFPAVFTKLVSAFTKEHVTYGDGEANVEDDDPSPTDFFRVG